MGADASWKLERAAYEAAERKGEEIVQSHGFTTWPIDPFVIIDAERLLIHAEGDDFRDSFDGRLSYHGERFLLCYNTRYNVWPRRSEHHPKVRFTIAHELGHFYLDEHRKYLVTRRLPHGSFSEFESNGIVERQADSFAAGLLMPAYLLRPRVNCEPDATIATIKQAVGDFDVSLTSMMVRWTRLTHYPSATLCIRHGQLQWGFVSEAFRQSGFWRARRNAAVSSRDAKMFMESESSFATFREGEGAGFAHDWLDGECDRVSVQEFYVVIPYSQCMLVFVTAQEDDLPLQYDDED